MGALTVKPLEKLGLNLQDVDKYAPEMQNRRLQSQLALVTFQSPTTK